ncbi:MAG: ABC transporter ATP-binding protein [Clostridia bacterium]|nr:ABC transporter ATP-binding protein [Clostridia bacterium]
MAYQNEQEFTNTKVDLSIWKQLFKYALRNKHLMVKTIIALIVVAAIDVIYPLMTNYAIDNFVVPQTTDGIGIFAAVYIVLVLIQGFGTFFFISRTGKMEMSISYDIRQDAYLRLQTLSFSFYDKTAVGYLMARMVSDVARLSEMIAWSIVDVLWAGCFAVGCVVIMFIKNPILALIVISVIPVLCFVSLFLQKRILRYQRESRRHNSRITGAFNEGIMGAMTTKTLVREDKNGDEFKELTSSMKSATVKASLLSAAFFPLVISLGAIGTSLALSIGGHGVISNGDSFIGFISVGALVAFISYASNLFDPIQQLAHIFAELQSAQASAERVMTLINTKSDIVDSPEVIEKYGDTMNPKRQNWEPLYGDVVFDHVSFSYKEGETVLDDFSLEVKQGETIALVGETGAGKSTIVNLICRFYEPTSGRILIDGRDYRERSQLWLQSNLGYVLQSPHLFSGSIMDNIRFGRPDATFEEVEAAAKMVHADEFIRAQQQGYDTDVGEGGGRLSIGQKQLLSFARVILANPKIFVLDEATSSIDTETEQAIQNAIVNVLKGRTSFIVAHRLSTIRNANRILVIRSGKIQESGTHEELLKLKGYYYDLYMNQYKEGKIQESLR